MKKGWISVISGLVLGVFISFLTLEYNGLRIIHQNIDGTAERTINELDFNLITNAFLIVVLSISMIYLVLTMIEKNRGSHDT